MKVLFGFIRRRYYWILFLFLELVSVNMLLRRSGYSNGLWSDAMTEMSGLWRSLEANVSQYMLLGEQNEALTRRNLELEHRIEVLSRSLAELTHDTTYAERKLLEAAARDMSDSTHTRLIAAHVVHASIRLKDNLFLIDRGESDGLRNEMGVVCGTGVVGIVFRTSAHYSVVMPVLHSKSSISCRVRGSDYYGYLRWEGGNPLMAVVDDVPRHANVKPGDVVETSGFSAVFPSGLFIGRVTGVHDSDDGLAFQLQVHLGADLARIRDVLVVANDWQDEIKELMGPEKARQ